MRRNDRIAFAVVVVLVAMLMWWAVVMPVRGAGACAPASEAALDAQEADFLARLNAYRAANGRVPLAPSGALNRAAAWMAADLAAVGYFSHTSSDGRQPSQRAADCGYPYGVGENIAGGTSSAQDALSAWQGSPGHNANLLGNYAVIGIGRALGGPYRVYWVTDFGGVVIAEPTPTATPMAARRYYLPIVAKD